MYSLLLEVQDFEKRFVQAPEEDRETLLEQHKANTVQLCNSLQEKEWDDRYARRSDGSLKDRSHVTSHTWAGSVPDLTQLFASSSSSG